MFKKQKIFNNIKNVVEVKFKNTLEEDLQQFQFNIMDDPIKDLCKIMFDCLDKFDKDENNDLQRMDIV